MTYDHSLTTYQPMLAGPGVKGLRADRMAEKVTDL